MPLEAEEQIFSAQSRLHPGVAPLRPLSEQIGNPNAYRMATPPFGGWPQATGWGNTAKGAEIAANAAKRAKEVAERELEMSKERRSASSACQPPLRINALMQA